MRFAVGRGVLQLGDGFDMELLDSRSSPKFCLRAQNKSKLMATKDYNRLPCRRVEITRGWRTLGAFGKTASRQGDCESQKLFATRNGYVWPETSPFGATENRRSAPPRSVVAIIQREWENFRLGRGLLLGHAGENIHMTHESSDWKRRRHNQGAHGTRWWPLCQQSRLGTPRREGLQPYGNDWEYLSHVTTRSRAYRCWNEDGHRGNLRPRISTSVLPSHCGNGPRIRSLLFENLF